MEVGEGGGHHGSHHTSFATLLLATVPGSQVPIMGETKDVALRWLR